MNAAFPTQQPLWLHVERMTQLYQLDRVKPRVSAPSSDLRLTVARLLGKFAAILGRSHRARQALSDPLLRRRNSLEPSPRPLCPSVHLNVWRRQTFPRMRTVAGGEGAAAPLLDDG
jgi:hypothetical protein